MVHFTLYSCTVELDLTTQSAETLINFVLAMMLFPEAQRAAKEELDRVVGRNRLPEMNDEDQLPYVVALKKEVLR